MIRRNTYSKFFRHCIHRNKNISIGHWQQNFTQIRGHFLPQFKINSPQLTNKTFWKILKENRKKNKKKIDILRYKLNCIAITIKLTSNQNYIKYLYIISPFFCFYCSFQFCGISSVVSYPTRAFIYKTLSHSLNQYT